MTGEPLMAGNKTLGAAVFVRSLDTEAGSFQADRERPPPRGGGIALLLALFSSWIIAKARLRTRSRSWPAWPRP